MGRRKTDIGSAGQGTLEFMLFAGVAIVIGFLLYLFSTPFTQALFYGDQLQTQGSQKVLSDNAGLERGMARPFP